MEKMTLKAEPRDAGKKGANRRLRKDGVIPIVLYGKALKARSLSVNAKAFTTLMKGHAGLNALLQLEITGETSKTPLVVMMKDLQIDAITRHITHVDLIGIDLKEKITVKVPLHVTGKAVGQAKGGLIDQPRREMEVICFPDRIPEKIDVDISSLDVGDSLHVHDIKMPEGTELPHGADFTIVSIMLPREEIPEVVAVPEAAAAAPAAAGAPGAPAEGAAAPKAAPKAEKGDKK